MGAGGEPRPTFVVLVGAGVVGWVDYDRDEREWLTHDEVNIGYGLHPDARGNGHATRAVNLLLTHLGEATDVRTATLLIDKDNDRSLAIPVRCGFDDHGVVGDKGARFFKRAVPPSTRSYTDGVVTLRPSRPEDRDALVTTRDDRFKRFVGEGDLEPHPTFCIAVEGAVVGWVDQEYEGQRHTWLVPGEVNIGYGLHPDARGKGLATRAVQLLMHHLAAVTDVRVGTLAIDADNDTSLAVARRAGFGEPTPLNDGWLFKKPVPPLTYTEGMVTIRPFRQEDLDRDIAAKDEEQIRWLWLPGQREDWESMTADEQRAHAQRTIDAHLADPRGGPKWSFVIDVGGSYAGHVDCDLANPDVPLGDANISYSSHPAERGRGYVSRAVRLIVQFLAEHTGARMAHVVVERGNDASLRVAHAVGASEVEEFVNERGQSMIRHELTITR